VAAAAERAGLEARLDTAAISTLADVELPVLAPTQDGGLDILWSLERDKVGRIAWVEASAPGQPRARVRITLADVEAASTGRIVRLRPLAPADARTADLTSTDKSDWFLSAFRSSRRIYAEAIAATIAINVLALAMPLFSMNVYDRVLPNAAAETLWALAIGVILATAFDLLIRTLRGHVVDAAGRRADVVLGNLVYARVLGARLEGIPASAGVRANTLRELDTLRDFFHSATLTAFGDVPFLMLFLAMIAVVAGPLVFVPLLAIPLILAIGWMTQLAIGKLVAASMRDTALKTAVAVETVAGLESLKAAGAESWAAAQWEKAIAESIRTSDEMRRLSNTGIHAVHGVQTLTQVVMIIVGFYMVAAGALTMGGLIAATMLAGRAMQPLGQMAHLISRLHQTRQSYQLLNDIVTAPQERPEGTQALTPAALSGALSFDAVTFRYAPDAAATLEGVSFEIRAGERIGLVGGIGTGKSTILKLVAALHRPQSGRVLADGLPVGQIDPAILRGQIGYALQQGELFHGTIRANVVLADPAADEARILDALRLSCALDWITRLPKGLDTPVRERGAGLSAGQRQTIVLARALLRRPKILLLDEPTSALDPRTEQMVVERLAPWLAGRTVLIVTHRPALLALVDRLIVLEGGKTRLDGPKASVLAALAQSQPRIAARREAPT
jgi:ATP-binding cassette subfamily C protein LapB